MDTKPRIKPHRLAQKLIQVRMALDLSQTEMLKRLGFEDTFTHHRVSEWETGKREPPSPVLLGYARAVGICLDVLVDDELDLPSKLPSKPKHDN